MRINCINSAVHQHQACVTINGHTNGGSNASMVINGFASLIITY